MHGQPHIRFTHKIYFLLRFQQSAWQLFWSPVLCPTADTNILNIAVSYAEDILHSMRADILRSSSVTHGNSLLCGKTVTQSHKHTHTHRALKAHVCTHFHQFALSIDAFVATVRRYGTPVQQWPGHNPNSQRSTHTKHLYLRWSAFQENGDLKVRTNAKDV